MAKAALSDLFLRNLDPPARGQRAIWDDKLPSFGVRISQGGAKTFVLNHRNTLVTIGRYPLTTLSEARTEAKRLLAEFTLGRIRPQSITYQEAVKLFIEDKKRSRRPTTYNAYEWLLARIGLQGQLSHIVPADMTHALKAIKSPSTYNHALVAARIFFNWCIKRRYVEHNPTTGLSPHSTTPRTRVLSDHELKCIWQACEQRSAMGESPVRPISRDEAEGRRTLPASFCTIVKLLILTGQRRNEIASLKAEYIKDDICTLPSTLTKNAREHTFPIGKLASSIIENSSDKHGLMFPARGKQSPFAGWSKAKAALDRRLGGTVAAWTLHDIRRYYASTMARLGVKQEVTERLLNHRSGIISGIAAVYTLHDFMPEMRAAVDLYQNHLERILKD